MKPLLQAMAIIVTICLSANPVLSQNVGIGTTTPSSRLEVKNLDRSTAKISSQHYTDTSELILSNRDGLNQGTDFFITARREEGLFFASTSDIGANNNDSLLTIRVNGNVGLGQKNPSAKLHVNGGVKIEGLNIAEFGAGIAGKELNAGKIGYNAFGQSALTIVGAGTNVTNRAVYLYAEGGTTFNGPINVSGYGNFTGQIRLNGSSGAAGQVLTSNGVSDPSWRSTSFTNTTRFGVRFTKNPSVLSAAAVITGTYYNLNTADVVVGIEGITINRSGLYHFDIGINTSLNFASVPSSWPTFGCWLFFGLPNSVQLIDNKLMQAGTSSNTFFRGHDKVSVELYIAAPATIEVYHTFISSGAISHNVEGFLMGHLISE